MRRLRVPVEFTKWDGRLHWHFRLDLVGEDSHGLWLAGPPGTMLQRGGEPPKAEVDGFVMLAPREGAWIAFWNAEDDPELYVDVTTPPDRVDGRVTAVDLDLDVVRFRDGRVRLLDEDEFADHRARLGYPPELVERARETAAWLVDAVSRRVEPFGTAGSTRLAALGW